MKNKVKWLLAIVYCGLLIAAITFKVNSTQAEGTTDIVATESVINEHSADVQNYELPAKIWELKAQSEDVTIVWEITKSILAEKQSTIVTLQNQIDELQQENKVLKEQNDELIEENLQMSNEYDELKK